VFITFSPGYFYFLNINKKKHGKALEMIKAAINHVLDDVCA